ncbi:MAG: methylated-DNA--[protein]-cysteine S-methyltransferase [Synergistaceae bacterium]|jgi:methylated-DNA-[protein]-cysteine S-methyltransferase|nr:methylated-DNA--[protein]-cysteine S-methyltransferase [Synergistaceae bacterium]
MSEMKCDWMRCSTPLGEMLLASDESAPDEPALGKPALCGAWFVGQKYFPSMAGWRERKTALFEKAAFELQRYFEGGLRRFTVPLRPRGTPFQQKVWAGIAEIGYGRTVSYVRLAARLKSSPRAVGSATGRNPLSLFVPCHRVVGSGGLLTGYAGGLKRKEALLTLEGIDVLEGMKVLEGVVKGV